MLSEEFLLFPHWVLQKVFTMRIAILFSLLGAIYATGVTLGSDKVRYISLASARRLYKQSPGTSTRATLKIPNPSVSFRSLRATMSKTY